MARAAAFPAERIAMHGNNKSSAELRAAVAAGVGRIIVDSFDEISRLGQVAAEAGVVQPVLVRVTVGVEAHTHEFIATAHEDQKFGFSLRDGGAARAVAAVLDSPALQLAGLHSHIGSQIFETAGFEIAAHRVIGLAATVRDTHGVEVDEINLGGGLGIAYVTGDDPETPKQTIDRLLVILERECAAAGLRRPRLCARTRPGRRRAERDHRVRGRHRQAGHARRWCGAYLRVGGRRDERQHPHRALRRAYTCALANRTSTAPPTLTRVVGKHCESGDIVVRDAWLPDDVRAGDLLAVAATGAYCRSMASNYNHVPRPPVVAVRDGASTVIVRRETEADLLSPRHRSRPGSRSMSDAIKIALLGCGVVGTQVVRLLDEQADDLAARVGAPLELAGIAVRRPARHQDVPAHLLTTDAAELVARDDVDVVIEVVGGIEPVRGLLLSALSSGKSVVSANKALLAEDGATLHDAAARAGVDLYYEAAVAGAIPLLRPLRESLAGDRITRVMGIVNGTTNFILSRMDATGAGFDEALAEAARSVTPKRIPAPTSTGSTPLPRQRSSPVWRSTPACGSPTSTARGSAR